MEKGKLYLIPSTIGEIEPLEVLPLSIKKVIDIVDDYIVENEKTARRFIKRVHPGKSQDDLKIYTLNKYTEPEELEHFLDAALEGRHMGVLSEAGAPAIADPGSEIVRMAHEKKIHVAPLVGPSSILLAMMASGLNGQNFAFVGYLPIDKAERKKRIKELERTSRQLNQSQLFIETPYRNMQLLEELTKSCSDETQLCIARDVTLPEELIQTFPISEWKKKVPVLNKKPTIFILHKY